MAQFNINPIQWHEGMLLMPQHFQQADMRMEGVLTYYMSHISPFFWGIVNLEIDEALLTAGTFRPLKLEAIMPDGLVVPALPETIQPLQLDLLPFRDKIQATPYFIYLCMPQLHGDNTDVAGDMPRYHSSLSANVVDTNTGQQPIDIPRLAPNLSLQAGLEPPAHYVCLPVAQVSCDSKSFALTEYIAPQIQVGLLTGIGEMCGQMAQRLREKLGYLQQKVQSAGERITKNPFLEEIEGIRLKLIAGLLPFEALLSIEKAPPFDVYRALCALAGQISGVKYGEIPPRFATYNHQDIKQSFGQVIDYIEKVLDEIEESYTVMPFVLNGRVFALQLQSEWVGDRLVLGIRAPSGMAEDGLIKWIKNCVIVTDQYVALAKDNRVLGAGRQIVSEVPSMNLVPTRGVQLLVVDVDSRYIDPKGVLCLFNMSDDDLTRPVEAVLYNSNEKVLGGR